MVVKYIPPASLLLPGSLRQGLFCPWLLWQGTFIPKSYVVSNCNIQAKQKSNLLLFNEVGMYHLLHKGQGFRNNYYRTAEKGNLKPSTYPNMTIRFCIYQQVCLQIESGAKTNFVGSKIMCLTISLSTSIQFGH